MRAMTLKERRLQMIRRCLAWHYARMRVYDGRIVRVPIARGRRERAHIERSEGFLLLTQDGSAEALVIDMDGDA